MTLTRIIVLAAASDAGDRSMRKAGRNMWDEDDFNVATAEFIRLNELLEDERDKEKRK